MRILSAVILLAFAFDPGVKAQIIPPQTVNDVSINQQAQILSSSEKIVKGAPFSAEAVSESVQILFDGNRIKQSAKARLYRDGEGRFRREELPKPVGIGSFVYVPQMIFILDPVASVKIYIYPDSKTFRESEFKSKRDQKQKEIERLERELQKFEDQIENEEKEIEKLEDQFEEIKQEFDERRSAPGYQEQNQEAARIETLKRQIEKRKAQIEEKKEQYKKRKKNIEWRKAEPEDWVIPEKKQSRTETVEKSETSESNSSNNTSITENDKPAKVAIESKTTRKETISKPVKIADKPNLPNNPSLPNLPKGEVKNESLGKRNMEGVEVEGVRLTSTVPVGAIGNERPIEIVYERWYSKELEMIVFSKYTDPRFGEQIYRLTNIDRSEPDSALFTPPADYKNAAPEKKPMPQMPNVKIEAPQKKPVKKMPMFKPGSPWEKPASI